MHKVALLWACLACARHGRRLETHRQFGSPVAVEEESLRKSSDVASHGYAEVNEPLVRVIGKGTHSPVKVLSMLLHSLNPSGSMVRPTRGYACRLGFAARSRVPRRITWNPVMNMFDTSTRERTPDWLMEQMLDIRTRATGKESPMTLAMKCELAKKMLEQGRIETNQTKLDAAEKMTREVWESFIKQEGKDTNNAMIAGLELGRAQIARGELDEAWNILTDVYFYRSSTDGEEGQSTLECRHEIGQVLKARGFLEGAEELHREVMEIRERTLGRVHEDTLASKRALLDVLMAAAQDDDRRKELEEELEELTREVVTKVRKEKLSYDELQNYRDKYQETPSHQQLDFTTDGEPVQLRFAYVDEMDCVGCTYCNSVAPDTFYMEEEAGRARVFNQGGNDPAEVAEAISCCPVNCIYYVDLEDLIILETEREFNGPIHPYQAGLRFAGNDGINTRTTTIAKMGAMGGCCNNCPSRGCKDCPMYGVGLNPVYLKRQEEREAKKKAKEEEKAQSVQDAEVERKLDVLFDFKKGFAEKTRFDDILENSTRPATLADAFKQKVDEISLSD